MQHKQLEILYVFFFTCGLGALHITVGTMHSFPPVLMRSTKPYLEQSFYRRFPITRESYDKKKEREVLALISDNSGWRRVGRPLFRRDHLTGIVLRKAPSSSLFPKGRITACVPYELSFNVAVLEHHEAHARLSRGENPHTIDSEIAAKYTGVDRDQLRYIRSHCVYCNYKSGVPFEISVGCSLVVHNLTKALNVLDDESHSSPMVEAMSTGVAPNHASGNDCNSTDLSTHARYSTLLWIGCEDSMTNPLSTQIIQHRHTTALSSALVPSCFLLNRAADLLRVSGPAFLSIDHEHVTAHQSLVIASFLEDSSRCQVRYQTGGRLQQQLVDDLSTSNWSTIIMLAWRRYDPTFAASVRNIYICVERYESSVIRVFPLEEELEHANGKIADIWALDEIARGAPFGWSYRPITCDCTSACPLRNIGVLKRTHSCGSEHVIVHPTAREVSRLLRCTADSRRMSKRKTAQRRERWFHQEFVEDLRRIGEFRVFIVTVGDVAATRGRKGEVVEVVHTIELEDKELVVTVLTSHLNWSRKPTTYAQIDIQELKRFALYVFDNLRNRPDWSKNFESLEIGARVDVGVTVVGESCRYFVNEVTRIYEADFFAEWLAQPGTHICRAVSMAFEEVFIRL